MNSLSQENKDQSSNSQVSDKKETPKSEYIYELPAWDLMPPATFIIRRVHRP